MDRPVMNPTFSDPEHEPPARKRRSIFWILTSPIRVIPWILLFDPVHWRRIFYSQQRPSYGRVIRVALGGVFFLPVLIPAVVAALVYLGTHPTRAISTLDPASRGIYFDAVTFNTPDEVTLQAWLVPVVDEANILKQREHALLARRPAVVLVHDEDGNRAQMLPLVRPLRDAGFVVLVVGLRSTHTATGSTFGLRESIDVRAAVDMLRRHPAVDPQKIAIVGVGTGANAAVLVADDDPALAALVLDRPTSDPDAFLATQVGPVQPWLKWLAPFCKWGFEMGYRVDADDLGLEQHRDALSSRPSLVFNEATPVIAPGRAESIGQIAAFLKKNLFKDAPPAPASPTVEIDVR